MRREGRVRGKPTSKTRSTGRCKSRPARLGRHERFATDVCINPSLTEFRLQPSLKHLRYSRDNFVEVDEDHEGISFVATVNSVIEAAFDETATTTTTTTTAVACTVPLLMSGAIDGTDVIAAIEEAFHRELGIFENAVEGTSFAETQFVRKWGSVLSEESWSDVEFLELSDLESSHDDDDDDWFLVLNGDEDDEL